MWTCCTLFASHRGIKLWPKPPFLLCWKELGLHEKLFSQVLQLYRFQLLAYTIEVFPISFAIKDFFYQSKPNFSTSTFPLSQYIACPFSGPISFFFSTKIDFFYFFIYFSELQTNTKQTVERVANCCLLLTSCIPTHPSLLAKGLAQS